MRKVCLTCGEEKVAEDFYKNRRALDGLNYRCKTCSKKADADRYAREREVLREKSRQRYQADRKSQIERVKKYQNENRAAVAERDREYRIKNLKRYAVYQSYARAKRRKRSIQLSEEAVMEIKAIYLKARQRTEDTGVLHHVDHIVPLQGDVMSGLHAPWNLQIITASENMAKKNKVDFELAKPAALSNEWISA